MAQLIAATRDGYIYIKPQPRIGRQVVRRGRGGFRVRCNATAMSLSAAQRLKGKTILITGASSGIGRSVSFEFARASPSDLRLILTARRVEQLKKVALEITEEVGTGVKILPVRLDVSQPDEVRSFVLGLPEEWRDIDVLVNNAYAISPILIPSLSSMLLTMP